MTMYERSKFPRLFRFLSLKGPIFLWLNDMAIRLQDIKQSNQEEADRLLIVKEIEKLDVREGSIKELEKKNDDR